MKFYKILLLTVLLFSCDNDLIVNVSPEGDYDLFFEYLKNDYAYRDFHPFTMEELKLKYLPLIKKTPTNQMLATILLNIEVNELKDTHVSIELPYPYSLINVEHFSNKSLDESIPLFYEINIIKHTPYYSYGIIKTNSKIGYLYVRSFNSEIGGTNSLEIESGVKEIDNIIKQLDSFGITSMIVDIRSGAGGTNYIPKYIAQRFVNKTSTYMVEEYPEGKSFKRKEWKVTPSGYSFRTKKIALLSNGQTASGGEMFVLAMLQRDNIIHIGSNSAGASGNIVDKDLSNGWNITITNSRTEFPNGKQYFKTGITPSIIVKNDTSYGQTTFNDKVIEKAIELLQ
jgi:hypothetical protein